MDNVLANDVGVDVDDDDDQEFGNNDFVIDGKDIDCISAIIDDVPLLACFECFGVFGVLGIFGVCDVIGDINDDDDEKKEGDVVVVVVVVVITLTFLPCCCSLNGPIIVKFLRFFIFLLDLNNFNDGEDGDVTSAIVVDGGAFGFVDVDVDNDMIW